MVTNTARHRKSEMTAPKPSPAVMTGRTDPALTVRPVDYSSWKPTTPPPADPPQGTVAASAPGAPVTGAANAPMSGPPKPGPGPRKVGEAPPAASRASIPLRLDPLIAHFVAQLRKGVQPTISAPESAVYTADSSGADTPAELTVPASGVHSQGVWDVTEDQLRRVVADPEDTWTADLGRTDYYVRQNLCVQVNRAEHRVVGIYRSGWALARRPDETWADGPDSPERTGAKPGGGGTRYPTNRRELLARLKAAGFHVTTSGPTHGKITHPEVPGRFIPFSSTPSSQRYGKHVTTAVKRVFGIDLRG
ncbi:hypothetical protein [Kocuria sp. cx-116]|uniref:hypothetical protein n=1 Tax=Kocuria sp. cx-116 TaxID=2771378 RepID=UPI002A4E1DF6|nr:hypothetical protein [Kocuria sp. cx-116]